MIRSTKKAEGHSLRVVHPDAAGIDIGSREHYVAVDPASNDKSVKSFGCTSVVAWALL